MRYESGRYMCRVVGQGFSQAKTGTDFFFLEIEPVSQVHPDGSQEPVEGQMRTVRLYITENTAEIVADKLKGIGWPGGRWKNLDLDSHGAHSFVDSEIEVECTHEPGLNDSSKLYDKWDLPFGDRAPMKSDSTVASRIDALFGKAAGPAKSPAKSLKQANNALAEAAAAAQGQDDIPF